MPQVHYRTIFLSDIHLGSKGCNAEQLLDFLKHTESEYLILVGDIIDFWALKRSSFWPTTHNTVVQKILKKAKHGTKVIFIHGNHDMALSDYIGISFGDITIHKQYVHHLITNESILCVHGDDFDVITRYHKWVAVLGDIGYDLLLWINRHYNKIRSTLGLNYWSLSSFIKHQVKGAINFIGDYENCLIQEANHQQVDGIICGHIHSLELRKSVNIIYGNCSDWVETCGGLVEHNDGTLQSFMWTSEGIQYVHSL
jgi:UDP-2,3-diacylglucosamine pyrophosphatase LpxH